MQPTEASTIDSGVEYPATLATSPLMKPSEKIGPIASAWPIAWIVVSRRGPRWAWRTDAPVAAASLLVSIAGLLLLLLALASCAGVRALASVLLRPAADVSPDTAAPRSPRRQPRSFGYITQSARRVKGRRTPGELQAGRGVKYAGGGAGGRFGLQA